jgi:pimeloyl-ACP methyl ester carboxylesterase
MIWIIAVIIAWIVIASIVFYGLMILVRFSDRRDERREGKKDRPSMESGEKKEGVRSLDGTPLYVDYLGDSDPTIFFVHGILGSGKVFRYQKPYFAGDYRVVSLDLRGHGRSSLPESGDFSTDRMAEDVKAAVDAFNPQSFVVVGHSMGGFTTFKFFEKFGKEYEGRLRGLAILDSSGTDVRGFSLRWKIDSIYLRLLWDNPLTELLKKPFSKSAFMYVHARWLSFGEKAPASEVEYMQEIASDTPIKTLKGAAKACMKHKSEHMLPSVNVPVLLLVGSEDTLQAKDRLNKRTYDLLPDARLKVIEGAGHNAMLEMPEEVNQALEEFFAECFMEGRELGPREERVTVSADVW